MHWRDIEEIAQQLEEHYAEEEIPEEDLEFLKAMVESLEGFEDIAQEPEEEQLKAIQEEWMHIRNC